MVEQPEPIILTEKSTPALQIIENVVVNPGKDLSLLGCVLIFCSIPMFWALDEFCCLMGLLSLLGGFIFIIIGLNRTYNWRKENDITKWTTSEIVSLVLISIIMIPILLLIVVVIMEDVGPFF